MSSALVPPDCRLHLDRSGSPLAAAARASEPHAHTVDRLRHHVLDARFPCVMAKSLLTADRVENVVLDRSERLPHRLHAALASFVDEVSELPAHPRDFRSLAVLFPDVRLDGDDPERHFEHWLWELLQSTHEVDDAAGHRWDTTTSSDPAADDFSISFVGRSFYVIGMHPGASRLARRTACPTLVFNMHAQFEALRALGAYDPLVSKIRQRDLQRQGSVNPMLERFGSASEARQYSGRAVDAQWRCPFSARGAA